MTEQQIIYLQRFVCIDKQKLRNITQSLFSFIIFISSYQRSHINVALLIKAILKVKHVFIHWHSSKWLTRSRVNHACCLQHWNTLGTTTVMVNSVYANGWVFVFPQNCRWSLNKRQEKHLPYMKWAFIIIIFNH